MVALLMTLFVVLAFFIALCILMQQGKGDMGLGGLGGGGGQVLFGGSGGQSFFEKATWVMASVFIVGSLALTVMKTRATQTSRVQARKISQKTMHPAKLPLKK